MANITIARNPDPSFPDLVVPPKCREMIRAGSLVAINTSGC